MLFKVAGKFENGAPLNGTVEAASASDIITKSAPGIAKASTKNGALLSFRIKQINSSEDGLKIGQPPKSKDTK